MTTKKNPFKDSFFTSAENTKPYFKAGLQGFAGAGKTFTAGKIAIGLHKKLKSKKPVVIFDTEKAAKFLKPLFKEAKIELLVRESRSMADLKETMERCRDGFSDILIIDSISHVWENFLEAYKKKVNRNNFQFQDWGVIKPTWKAEFSDPFVNDPYHVLMCGRAGYEYENEVNPDTKRREIHKSGIKMKVEGETAYEPDMLVLMNRFEKVLEEDKKVWREATILKDRSNTIDGKTFKNPTFKDFESAIDVMMSNPIDKNIMISPEGDSALLFKTEEEKNDWKRHKDKWLEELQGLFTRVAPGATGKDKQFKLEVLAKVFDTTSETAIRALSGSQLRDGYKKVMDIIVKEGLAEYVMKNKQKVFRVIKK